jgi:hypothetical protein
VFKGLTDFENHATVNAYAASLQAKRFTLQASTAACSAKQPPAADTLGHVSLMRRASHCMLGCPAAGMVLQRVFELPGDAKQTLPYGYQHVRGVDRHTSHRPQHMHST